MMKIEPVVLQGHLVRLEPLRLTHARELYEASRDPTIWTHLLIQQPQSFLETEQHITTLLQAQQAGERLPFAIIDLEKGCVVGETGYHSFQLQDRGLEIGITWLAPWAQRTGINTECKYLLLRHAFETLGTIRVQFRTRTLNRKSQQAIERLGAVKEGVLRNHFILPDGSYGHRIYYSIIECEWPSVKAKLETLMHRQ